MQKQEAWYREGQGDLLPSLKLTWFVVWSLTTWVLYSVLIFASVSVCIQFFEMGSQTMSWPQTNGNAPSQPLVSAVVIAMSYLYLALCVFWATKAWL